MKRQEQLSAAADKFTADKKHYVERCRWLDGAEWADRNPDIDAIKSIEDHAYFAGSEATREKLIDKACDWLKNNKDHPSIGCEDCCLSGFLTDDFIEDFRKAMEE